MTESPAACEADETRRPIPLEDITVDADEGTADGQNDSSNTNKRSDASPSTQRKSKIRDKMPQRLLTGWRAKLKDLGSIQDIDAQECEFDFCLIYDLGDQEKMIKTKDGLKMDQAERYSRLITNQLRALQTAGLKVSLYRSIQGDELYVLIGATEERLRFEAHRTEFDLELDPTRALDVGLNMSIRLAQRTVDDSEKAKFCGPELWENLFGKYDKDADPRIYRTYPNSHTKESLFRAVDRFKLIVSIVEADNEASGAEIAIGKSLDDGDHPALAFFPLHDEEELQKLEDDWKPTAMFNSPIYRVRDYFGEKVALYFAFLSFYNRALVFPAVMGVIYFGLQLGNDRVNVRGIWVLGFSMAVWGTVFLEYWKRKEAKLRVEWGMTQFAEKEQTRPEFRGELVASNINGMYEMFYPWPKKIARMFLSSTVIISLIACVVAAVSGIFIWKSQTDDPRMLYVIAAVNSIQIQILNVVLSSLSQKLNENENHRTDTEFENALIAKSFVFKFVNSYNTLFYIAFVKWNYEANGCASEDNANTGATGCLLELRVQLGVIFGSMIVVNNALEIIKPTLSAKWRSYKESKGLSEEMAAAKTRAELQYEKAEMESTFADYDELVLQYGFVVLFIVALPITPLFALANNFLETWLDSRKYTSLTRRPEPRGASNIGTWFDILNILTVIAIVTNVAMCVLISGSFEDSPLHNVPGGNVWIFLIAEHVIVAMKFAAEYFILDEPLDVQDHISRQKYIVAALIDEVPDDDDGDGGVEEITDEATFNYAENIAIGFDGNLVTFDNIEKKLLKV